MSQFSWIDNPVSPELGAIAHGPRLLSDSNGYRVGLRYLIAYRNVMDMVLTVSASGLKSAELAAQFVITYGAVVCLRVQRPRTGSVHGWCHPN